jgi:hypothetical protein
MESGALQSKVLSINVIRSLQSRVLHNNKKTEPTIGQIIRRVGRIQLPYTALQRQRECMGRYIKPQARSDDKASGKEGAL